MYRSIIRFEKPVFVPKSLDENAMLKLRQLAFDETNLEKLSWVPKIVKRNTFIQKVYRRPVSLKGDWNEQKPTVPKKRCTASDRAFDTLLPESTCIGRTSARVSGKT
jgi:hypothetical protein